MKTRPFMRYFPIPLLILLILTSLFVTGCDNKENKQEFVNDYLDIMENLKSDPAVAEQGRKAATAYLRSGCTDLESADVARESYEASVERDKEKLKTIDSMVKPDKEAEEIAAGLSRGIQKIDDASSEYALKYKAAKNQSVEERVSSSQDVMPILEIIVKGMTELRDSLEKLLSYIEENGLKAEEDARIWFDTIESQVKGLKSRISQ